MAFLTVRNCLVLAALLPLLSFAVLWLWGSRMGRSGTGPAIFGLFFAVASFGLSVAALLLWVESESFNLPNYVDAVTHRWISFPGPMPPSASTNPLSAPASPAQPLIDGITGGILIDSLTVLAFLVFTTLNVLLHIYAWGSLGEMPLAEGQSPLPHQKSRLCTWMSFLNFALLALLLSNSLPQLFAFGELVTLGCFALIRGGVANPKTALRYYALQALGSVAMLIGMGILASHIHLLSGMGIFDATCTSILSQSVRDATGFLPSEYLLPPNEQGFLHMHWLTWAGICFLVTVFTRLAQFPFHTWLHDVAEAPAAVTALVSAAMLIAGTLLLARLYPILTLDARFVAAVMGCITLAVGALIALVQTDLRKVLIWSTVSHAGYVVLFMGAGGYTAGVLHLITHLLVKTALLMAAGSIVQGSGTADLKLLGGLWKRFPITAIASLVAVVTLAGVPWLSIAYSTNIGLDCVYDYTRAIAITTGWNTALLYLVPAGCMYLSALAIGRWWWLIFAGSPRDAKRHDSAHESAFLTLGMFILAGSFAGGIYNFFTVVLPLITKSIPSVLLPKGGDAFVISGTPEAAQAIVPLTGWAFTGCIAAVILYGPGLGLADKMRRLPGINMLDYWLRQRMFFDELYEGVLLPLLWLVAGVAVFIEGSGRLILRLFWRLSFTITSAARHMEKANQQVSPPAQEPAPTPTGQSPGTAP